MPRLTDQEKQDILRHWEADRPLPDKYRFLLFGDKREVELVWNGKTNEVTNVVLPFQTIEHVDEPRAESGWLGSSAASPERRKTGGSAGGSAASSPATHRTYPPSNPPLERGEAMRWPSS